MGRRPVNNPTMASACSQEVVRLTLSQKLEMTKLGEEGTQKAESRDR